MNSEIRTGFSVSNCLAILYLLSPVAYEMCAQYVNLSLNNKTYEQMFSVNYITEIKYSIVVMVTNRGRVTGFHLHAGEGESSFVTF